MPRDLFDILADGGDHRNIVALNGQGTPALSLGVALADELDAEVGDTVGVQVDHEERKLEVFFGPERPE
ncbi:hypothetical protein [Halosegnis marinus]|uniref:Uncharacterized protein n=1 Tax=Halosegnis marinus TaxID=3034023 RepID=A0ABD5ZSY9_9EURY|nr:hypothetical protein [Halosegnis sp. DT85]